MIRRGTQVQVGSRVYKQFEENIQVFEQKIDMQIFLHAFSLHNADAADELMRDLGASGCTGKGECHNV